MIRYVKHFDSNKTMYFKVNESGLLKSIPKYGEKLVFWWICNLMTNLFMVIMINT